MKSQNPHQPERANDTFHIGRSCMDLYSNDVGASFVHIRSSAAYVGGSPTNMSVGCRRLGLKSALLTAFGDDHIGDLSHIFQRAEFVMGAENEIKAARLGNACGAMVVTRHGCSISMPFWGRSDGLHRRARRHVLKNLGSISYE
jgi:sugar/nucleoside kinase (ribokinase family)